METRKIASTIVSTMVAASISLSVSKRAYADMDAARVAQIQQVYDQGTNNILNKSHNAQDKAAIVNELLKDISNPKASPVIRHAASYVLYYSLLPWHNPGWDISADMATKILATIDSQLSAEKTPDEGTRRYLAGLAGLVAEKIASHAIKMDDKPRDHALAQTEQALINAAHHEKSSYVAAQDIKSLAPFYSSPKVLKILNQLSKDPRPAIRAMVGPTHVADTYKPTQSVGSLDAMHQSAEDALANANVSAKAMALQGKNILANYERDPKKTQAISSAEPWGGGCDNMSLLSGDLKYNSDFGTGPCGPAYPGGPKGYAGMAEGWQGVTVLLKQADLINQVKIRIYSSSYGPKEFRVLVHAVSGPNDADGGKWILAFTTDHNEACLKGEPSGCAIPVSFPKVFANQIRVEFNNGSAEEHVWLSRLEASYQPEASPNS